MKRTIRSAITRAALFACSIGPAALAFSAAAEAQTPSAPVTAPAPDGARLDVDRATIPLVLIHSYPFVDGAINGRAGKLLFDLGSEPGLSIDNHTVAVPNGVVVGKGHFGSGQTFDKMRFPVIDSLTLAGGLRFDHLTNIGGNFGLPLEQHFTPDFIGWIGIRFFDAHVMKLDYRALSASFYRNDPGGAGLHAAEAGEHIIGTVALGNMAHPNLATTPLTLAGLRFTGLFDTGSTNSAWLTQPQIDALKAAGVITPVKDDSYTLTGLALGGRTLPSMPLDIRPGPPPFAALLPDPTAPVLVLGAEFLGRYRTIWDYQRRTMAFAAY